MIRKLNSTAVHSYYMDYTQDKDCADITAQLVKEGDMAAFMATAGTSYNKVAAYIKRRFPSLWHDYVAVADVPSPLDFLDASSRVGAVWQELKTPAGTLWLVNLDA